MNNYINTSRVRLAQVRYFDVSRKASELPINKAYVVLANVNGTYVNILNPFCELPVFERSSYHNVNSLGEDYGNKLYLVNGELQDGECLILENVDMKKELKKEKVTIEDIEEYVLTSNRFFVDRINLLKSGKRPSGKCSIKKIMKDDIDNMRKLNTYLGDNYRQIQYKK